MIFDFNGDWIFVKENGDSCIVHLPHDAMISEKRYAECRSGKQGGYFPGGKYRYKKQFNISEEDIGKRIELLFEGVYRNAEIIINDNKVCSHKYGYTEFIADISVAVRKGINTVG